MTPEKVPDFSDLAASVFVCTTTYDNALEAMPTMKLQKEMAKWQKSLGVFNFPQACDEFVDYVTFWLKEPPHRWKPNEGGSAGSDGTIPKAQGVKISLMTHLGFRECELVDRPWRLCVLDWLTWNANEGNLKFIDDDEQQTIKAISQMTPEQLEAECKRLKEARNGTA